MGQEIKTVDFDGLVAGIHFFDPTMVNLVMYPVAGAIVVSVGEILVAPLTISTILSQLEGNNNYDKRKQEFGGLELFLRSKFGYRLSYFGITSFANACFKHLFVVFLRFNIQVGQCFLMCGAFSALTASTILLPFKTSTNKGYTATFRDIWRDGGFRSVFLKAKPGVAWMTLGILLYELKTNRKRDEGVYIMDRVMLDLTRVVMVSVADEIVRGLGVDVDNFFHTIRKKFGLHPGSSFGYRLCYFGIAYLANSCFKPLLFPDNMPPFQLFLMSGSLSALTAYIILLPYRTSTNYKRYTAIFRDIWRDENFGLLLLIMFLEVGVMATAIFTLQTGHHNEPRGIMEDLGLATIFALMSMVPDILIVADSFLIPSNVEISKWLCRGNMVNILYTLTYRGVNSFAYLNLRSLLTAYVSSSWPKSVAFTSGALASLAACLVSHPLDTLITHITFEGKDHDDAPWKTTIADLCKKDGHLSSQLYAGLSASLFSIVPSMTVSFVAFEAVSLFCGRPRLMEETGFKFDLARTSIATLTASAVMYPIEVVRRRMQMERGTAKRVGLLETFKRMIRTEGVEGLYSGIDSHLVKVVVGHALAFTAFELFMKLRSK